MRIAKRYKYRKFNYEYKQKKRFMKKQKIEENFRNRFKELEYKSSSDESSIKNSSHVKLTLIKTI